MTEDEVEASRGEWLWVPHPTEVFVAGKVVSESGGKVSVQLEDGTSASAKRSATLALSRPSLKRIVPDLTLLDAMSTPLILHNLRQRFELGKPVRSLLPRGIVALEE